MSVPVISIDGPSASGKGTVSRALAKQWGWHFLDSGALYRLTGLAALQAGVSLEDESALAGIARGLDIQFRSAGDDSQTWLAGKDVSLDIRSERCSQAASKVAVFTEVRQALLERQRAFRLAPGLVADGRDMGTVVFPDAELKIFITASPEERAQRRLKQLNEQGINVNLADLLAEIQVRDKRDRERSNAPLLPAPDAVVIDTTTVTVAQVVQQISDLWRRIDI